MLFKRQNKIEELEKRCVILARANKQLEDTIEDLNDKVENRDYFIKEQNKRIERKQDLLKNILRLTECNMYNNEKIFLDKINELVQTGIEY